MRILQLVTWLSARQDDGGIVRSTSLARILSRFAEVDVIGFRTADDGTPLESAPALQHYGNLYPVRLDGTLRRGMWALANLGQGYSLRSAAFRAPAYRRRVGDVLRTTSYDAIQVEGLSIMQNLDLAAAVPVVYSAHNVESVLSPRLLGARTRLPRRCRALDRRRTESEERRVLQQASLCLAVSAADKRSLERLALVRSCAIHVIPNCVSDEIVPAASRAPNAGAVPEVVCIASFRWYPNIQGTLWFLDEILPRLRRNGAGCSIRFVGSGINPGLARKILASGCAHSADVPATLPFLHRARASVVPLLIGGGTRIKIVEAWAAGVPVVSTHIGAEGLDCAPGVDAMLADDPDAFAGALQRVLEDDELHQRLRANGLQRAEALRWSRVGPVVEQLYASLLRKSGEPAPRGCCSA
jgi:glycosyltransferase involved in cell wall biosynthesis